MSAHTNRQGVGSRARRFHIVLVPLLFAIVAAAVASAVTTLTPVQALSPAGRSAFRVRLGVDGSGTAVFAWQQWDGAIWRIHTRTRAADGTLSPRQVISPPSLDAQYPEVAVDVNGNAVVVWICADCARRRVYVRARSADGTFGPVLAVSNGNIPDSAPPAVAIDLAAMQCWPGFVGTSTGTTSKDERFRPTGS